MIREIRWWIGLLIAKYKDRRSGSIVNFFESEYRFRNSPF